MTGFQNQPNQIFQLLQILTLDCTIAFLLWIGGDQKTYIDRLIWSPDEEIMVFGPPVGFALDPQNPSKLDLKTSEASFPIRILN